MIITFDDLAGLRAQYADKKLVLSSGTFDLLHVNHLHYLKALRDYGDIVVVMVASDARVAASKGSARPIIPEADRAELLDGLKAIDYVFVEPGASKRGEVDPVYADVFARLQPDVFVTANETWGDFKQIMGNTELIILPRVASGAYSSTSAIIARAKSVIDDK
jgi:cytidyltransferase-like protein